MHKLLPILLVVLVGSWVNEAAAGQRPNVLLIISDDLRPCLGCYGNDVCQTPHLDRLAREGVRFSRAYCQFPLCGPSRASLMSGLYPDTTRMRRNSGKLGAYRNSNPELADHPSIGEFLRTNGYYSARISKIYHMGIPGDIESGQPGGDDPASWDWTCNVLAPETFSPGRLELLTPEHPHWGSNFSTITVPDDRAETQPDVIAADQAIAVLENRTGDRPDVKTSDRRLKPGLPFFLAVGFVRPHVPLVAPERLFETYPASQTRLPDVAAGDLEDVPPPAAAMRNSRRYKMNEEQQRKAVAGYYASVTFMDEQVGRLLDTLDRLDIRDNTIVIFTSDHGYQLGEHHCWQKVSLFEDSTRVPLLISAPGFDQSDGKTAEGIVELVDLYPTITDLLGLAEEDPRNLQGTSLVPLLENPAGNWPKKLAYTVTRSKGKSIRTPSWRYSAWGKAGEELYDLENDPGEVNNLAGNPEYADVLETMRDRLDQKRRESTWKR